MLIIIFAIVAGAITLDQITKAIVVANMDMYEEAPFIPGLIRFYRTKNTGGAFSMLNDKPWILMIFTLIAMAGVAYCLFKYYKRHPMLAVSLAMILGGGIGNLIDRTVTGEVVDFLDFQFMNFAVFNVADIFVTCGAVLLAVYVIFLEPKVEKKLKAEKEASLDDGSDSTDSPS